MRQVGMATILAYLQRIFIYDVITVTFIHEKAKLGPQVHGWGDGWVGWYELGGWMVEGNR